MCVRIHRLMSPMGFSVRVCHSLSCRYLASVLNRTTAVVVGVGAVALFGSWAVGNVVVPCETSHVDHHWSIVGPQMVDAFLGTLGVGQHLHSSWKEAHTGTNRVFESVDRCGTDGRGGRHPLGEAGTGRLRCTEGDGTISGEVDEQRPSLGLPATKNRQSNCDHRGSRPTF